MVAGGAEVEASKLPYLDASPRVSNLTSRQMPSLLYPNDITLANAMRKTNRITCQSLISNLQPRRPNPRRRLLGRQPTSPRRRLSRPRPRPQARALGLHPLRPAHRHVPLLRRERPPSPATLAVLSPRTRTSRLRALRCCCSCTRRRRLAAPVVRASSTTTQPRPAWPRQTALQDTLLPGRSAARAACAGRLLGRC